MADLTSLWLPVKQALLQIMALAYNFVVLFMKNDVMTWKVILFAVMVLVLSSIIASKWKSASASFLVSSVVSIIALRFLSDNIITLLMTTWHAFFFVTIPIIIFLAITFLMPTVWWVRRGLLGLMVLVSLIKFLFYGGSYWYVLVAILAAIFLAIDGPLHRFTVRFRERAERKRAERVSQVMAAENTARAISLGVNKKDAEIWNDKTFILCPKCGLWHRKGLH